MPAFEVEKYIIESIKSIENQTYKNWELVIIDDCSTDNTFDVLKTITETKMYQDERIKIFKRDSHCGKIGKLKNECIAKFEKDHKYICHVGSDDKIPPYCFQTFVDYMEQHPETGACCGNFICFNDEGKQWTFPHVSNSGEFDSNTLLRYMSNFPMRFYLKSVVDKVGKYDENLSSAVDYDLALKIDEITKIHRIIEPITYYYRQHENQVSTKARPEQDLNAKTALENALKRRKINGKVIGDRPPFKIEYKEEEHFIWGKK